MSLKLGSTSIDSLYLGSIKIGAAYVGGTKIYESTSAPFVQQAPTGITMSSGTQWPTNVDSVTELQVSASVSSDASKSAVFVAIAPNSTDYSSSFMPVDAVRFRLSSVSADNKTGVWKYTLSATERANVSAGTHRIWVWRDLGNNVYFNLVSADCGYYGVASGGDSDTELG